MKIAYVSREFGPITGGGIGTYIANVTGLMAARGHQIWLVTDCFNDENRHFLPPGVTLVPTLPSPPDREGQYFTPVLEYADRVYQTLLALDREFGLEVVEFSEYGGEAFTSVRAKRVFNDFERVKLVVKLHTPKIALLDLDPNNSVNHQVRIDVWAEDYSVRWADLVTSPSQFLADYFKERLGLTEIPASPYPLELTTRLEKPRRFDPASLRRVVLLGKLAPVKGVDTFIEAAKLVLAQKDDFIFEIYGPDLPTDPFDRSYQRFLERLIPPELTDRIVFKGALPYALVPPMLLQSGFVVLPSRWENWPNACLEAMMLGNVVIGSRRGGMAEMIEDGVSGFLVDPDRPDQIARTLLENYKSVEKLEAISEAARQRVPQWTDPARACAKIEAVYQLPVSRPAWQFSTAPKVSVVIPLYNQGQFVHDAIASAQAQTYPNVEIIVVNDGSTDPLTNRVFEELSEKEVIKLSQLNRGVCAARNTGIAASTGEYIVPLDADDRLDPRYIERGLACLQNNPELDYVTTYIQYFGLRDKLYPLVGWVPEVSALMNTEGSCRLYRKTILEAVGGYDEGIPAYNDWELQVRLNLAGFQGDLLPEPLFFHRWWLGERISFQAPRLAPRLFQYIYGEWAAAQSTDRLVQPTKLALHLWRQSEISRADSDEWFERSRAESDERFERTWVELNRYRRELEKAQARLEEVYREVAQARDQQYRMRGEITELRTKLHDTNVMLQETERTAQAEIGWLREQNESLQAEVAWRRGVQTALEGSRLHKLRQVLLKPLQFLRLH